MRPWDKDTEGGRGWEELRERKWNAQPVPGNRHWRRRTAAALGYPDRGSTPSPEWGMGMRSGVGS
jgi:hypothetical protein